MRRFRYNFKEVRVDVHLAYDLAEQMMKIENDLVLVLSKIDQQKSHSLFGYNSLSGFCRHGLKFGKTQSQRIVTLVRRTRYDAMNQRPTS